jgi:heptosyltransferase-2
VVAAVEARGLQAVVVGRSGDGTERLIELLPATARNLMDRTDLDTLAAVLARCRVTVSNDSGVMHLATAMGTPTVAVFGPSNPVAWGPWDPSAQSRHRVVALEIPCRPCFYVGHELGSPKGCQTRDCLAWLGTEPVVRALDDVLARQAQIEP